MDAADGSGRPVASVGTLSLLPVTPEQIRAAAGATRSRYGIDWTPADLSTVVAGLEVTTQQVRTAHD